MPSTGDGIGPLLDLDVQPPVGLGVGGAGDATVQALEGDGAAAAGQPDAVGDLGDRADVGKFLFVSGDEQHPLLLAGVDREREGHAREDHDVVERDQKKTTTSVSAFTFDSCLLKISEGYHVAGGYSNDLSRGG